MKQRSLLYIGNQLLKSKKVTITSIETLGKFLEEEGYRVRKASHYRFKPFRLLHMVYVTLRYANRQTIVLIDTYSTQNYWYAVIVGLICRLKKVKYMPILRGGDLPQRLEKNKGSARRLFQNASVNIAPSNYLLEAFKAAKIENVVFIPNTIEIKKYVFQLREFPKPNLLWVRSFVSIYNPFLAIRVLEQLLIHYPQATLCMVGPDRDGSLQACQAYVQKRNLPVTFTGKLSKEAWRELAADYDIFINTTNFDNTPVSVLEAMALGLPVVSTDVGGLPYLLEEGEEALLVPAEEIMPFVQAIMRLLEDPSLAQKLGKKGREKVEAFDWGMVKEQWFDLLGE